MKALPLPQSPGGTQCAPSWAGRGILAVTLALVAFGLLSVYSASSFIAQSAGLPDTYYLFQQFSRVVVGMLAFSLAAFLDYRRYEALAWPLVVCTAALLLLLLVPGTDGIAPRVNGARRWIRVGVAFQPSEIAKLAVIVWTAHMAVKKQDRLHSLRLGLLPILMVDGFLCLLVLLEPHFSAAAMIAAFATIILFCAGGRLGHFAFLGMLALPIVWDQVVHTGYRIGRIAAFLNPEAAAADVGYQLRQSLIAIGSGGLFGVGFGQSSQKMYYLPEPQNDFIFSIIAEEWGLIGSAVVIGLFVAWALLGVRIAAGAPDLFGRLLAVGITAFVSVAALAHIAVTLGVLPTTGVNLPFVSAGGTNLVLALGATGVLLNIAKQRGC